MTASGAGHRIRAHWRRRKAQRSAPPAPDPPVAEGRVRENPPSAPATPPPAPAPAAPLHDARLGPVLRALDRLLATLPDAEVRRFLATPEAKAYLKLLEETSNPHGR